MEEIISEGKKAGLTTNGIKIIKDKNTGVCIAIRNDEGERVYISYLGSLSYFECSCIPVTDYLILTGYFTLQGIRKNIKQLFESARKK